MLRDDATLLDIDRAARLALGFRDRTGPDEFWVDLMAQSAVLHQLMVIGGAIKRLSEAFRAEHPEIPWRGFAGM